MARMGGGGASLNPFGSGTLTNFGQYDVAGNLADLATYEVEVRWGNGQATDAEYQAALLKSRDARDVGSRDYIAAQNKLDDVNYRIGRAAADAKGLDDLIAFDQTSLGKMSPDNLRARDISDSLKAELAQRRSRDYGKLVTDYNAGKSSTQSLIDWVTKALGSLAPDAPDKDNWTGVLADLSARKKTERDAEVYQRYQDHKMKPAEFLAYVKSRRDGYTTDSPDYAEWNRKLADATKQAKDTAQAAKDNAFFNSYQEGHKSDHQYLLYLRHRVDGMEHTDPDLPEWKHRLRQATFSIAEDELRFKVERGTAKVGALISFYKNYRRTLNPNSPEYRQITRALDSLAHAGGGGGGGGRRGTAKARAKAEKATVGASVGKLISPKYTLESVLPLLTVDASKKGSTTAAKAFDLNYQSLVNATQRGDAFWVFYDPRKPGAVTQMKQVDPATGKLVVVRDAKGRPVMVPGSAYLPTTGQALANLDTLKVQFHYQLAAIALSHHDAKGYFYQMKVAADAYDSARIHQGQYVAKDNREFYNKAQQQIDLAVKTGDYATAINISIAAKARLDAELADPSLDDTRRGQLENLRKGLLDNPLVPSIDEVTGKVTSPGAVDLARSTSTVDAHGNRQFQDVELNPGWHQVLDKTDAKGAAAWGLAYDAKQDGTWEQTHVTVYTQYGAKLVKGEVTRRTASVDPLAIVSYIQPDGSAGGQLAVSPPKGATQFISFTDENGQTQRAYSLDGKTWIRPNAGEMPMLQFDTAGLTVSTNPDGTSQISDAQGNVYFRKDGDSWSVNPTAWPDLTKSGSVHFFGQKEAQARIAAAPAQHKADVAMRGTLQASQRARVASGQKRDPRVEAELYGLGGGDPTDLRGNATVVGGPGLVQNEDGSYSWGGGTMVFGTGAPGSHMTLTTADDDGTVNLLRPGTVTALSYQKSIDTRYDGNERERSPGAYTQLPATTPRRYEGVNPFLRAEDSSARAVAHPLPIAVPALKKTVNPFLKSESIAVHVTPAALKTKTPVKIPVKKTVNPFLKSESIAVHVTPKKKAPTPPKPPPIQASRTRSVAN